LEIKCCVSISRDLDKESIKQFQGSYQFTILVHIWRLIKLNMKDQKTPSGGCKLSIGISHDEHSEIELKSVG
jgi:hypothetical protein